MAFKVVGFLVSLTLTVSLLVGSLVLLHQAHQFSQSVVPSSTRLFALELACPLLSVLCYASPVGSVIAMVRRSDRSDFPMAIIVAQTVQNLASSAYGIHIKDDPFFLSSAIGLGFQLIWLTAWYAVVRRLNQSWHVHPAAVSAMLALVFVCTVFALTRVREDIVGYLSCVLTLLLCVSPLANLGIVVRSKNSASIPIARSLVMLVANVAWALYGVLLEDRFVYMPSIFGFLITVFQLLVTAWCSGYLFFNLEFLQCLFGGGPGVYHQLSPSVVELQRRMSSAASSSFGLEEQRED